MREIEVRATNDHISQLSKTSPTKALAELIWNGLDADANKITISFEITNLQYIQTIKVDDFGHGIDFDEVDYCFGNLGNSWKKKADRSKDKKRILHGKEGQGRFRAFALGEYVSWDTRYRTPTGLFEYHIAGSRATQTCFQIDDKPRQSSVSTSGTQVTITNVDRRCNYLTTEGAQQEITELLALYLTQYREVEVDYNGTTINPSDLYESVIDLPIDSILTDEMQVVTATLTVVEWKRRVEHGLYLCNGDGFALERITAGVRPEGFFYTAYLSSDYISEADQNNTLLLWNSDPVLSQLIEAAREKLKAHFRKKASEAATDLVDEWKKEQVYPFVGEPANLVEEIERQVFDVCALSVNSFLPEFSKAGTGSKRFSFRLLKHAIETGPSALQRILSEVLELSEDKQQELADLLERTTLEAIINAAREVTERLDFLRGMESLVFDPSTRKATRERTQLHRLVARHAWIFGDQYHLSSDDESLTNVLRKHLAFRGDEIVVEEPVVMDDGREGVVDLMMSKRIKVGRNQYQHLVIELKRPSVSIDFSVLDQVDRYADAIIKDERFVNTGTHWVFWAVSNKIDDRTKAKGIDKPIFTYANAEVWVRDWGSIIDENRERLEFFQQQLNFSATKSTGLEYLRRKHAEYLPNLLVKDEESQQMPL